VQRKGFWSNPNDDTATAQQKERAEYNAALLDMVPTGIRAWNGAFEAGGLYYADAPGANFWIQLDPTDTSSDYFQINDRRANFCSRAEDIGCAIRLVRD
jgi:hypothetical protein